jgi:hypothetical protein
MGYKILPFLLLLLACSNNEHKAPTVENSSAAATEMTEASTVETVMEETNFSTLYELAKTNKEVAANLRLIRHLRDSLYSEEKLKNIPSAALPPAWAVTIYSDKNFGGAAQNLGYIGDLCWREESLTIPRSSLSSIKVPFGMNATLFGRWDCALKLTDLAPVENRLLPEDLNDKTRSIKILNKSVFFTAIRGSAHGSLFDINKRFKIPDGYTVKWQEATRAGDAKWRAWIANDSFYIRISVTGPGMFGPASWCGVDAWLEKK